MIIWFLSWLHVYHWKLWVQITRISLFYNYYFYLFFVSCLVCVRCTIFNVRHTVSVPQQPNITTSRRLNPKTLIDRCINSVIGFLFYFVLHFLWDVLKFWVACFTDAQTQHSFCIWCNAAACENKICLLYVLLYSHKLYFTLYICLIIFAFLNKL